MKKNIKAAVFITMLLVILIASTVSAQYAGYYWSTSYQVMNIGTADTNIDVAYYDTNGNEVVAAHKTFQAVPKGGVRVVVQFTDDPALTGGSYSAVVSSTGQPIAANVNQQLIANSSSSFSPQPPFSSYNGTDSTGTSTTVTIPEVMYNWYNYYSEIFIMNASGTPATNVDISYTPTTINGVAAGATGKTDLNNSIPKYATIVKSQQSQSSLGAPSGTYSGRFLGSATITSDQPIVAIVNEHNVNQRKLMSYNGFAQGAPIVAVPQHLKNWYGYYGSLLIANPSPSQTASGSITYTPDPINLPGKSPVTVPFSVPPQSMLNRYDGPGATAQQSDLGGFTRFIGSVQINSNIAVVVKENIEAVNPGAGQAGSYNGMAFTDATPKIYVPMIQADYYGYYTSLTVQNTTGAIGSCTITYYSDSQYSDVKNQSKSYSHTLPANGSFNVYEGHGSYGTTYTGDINTDTFWRAGSGKKFIGSAIVDCGSTAAVAYVNSEKDIANADSMYTFNAINGQ